MQASRPVDSVAVLAATKSVNAEYINQAAQCGITLAGENRVQEFLSKADGVCGVTWHFIGSLQTNKVKSLIGKTALIHSVDRIALADEIEKQSAKLGVQTNILIEINAGCEDTKSGVLPQQVEALYTYCKQLPHIRINGFMPVLPINAPEKLYAQMNGIFSAYKARDPHITQLSMGMSGDYETAIRYGATIVRLGSCLFGSRLEKEFIP